MRYGNKKKKITTEIPYWAGDMQGNFTYFVLFNPNGSPVIDIKKKKNENKRGETLWVPFPELVLSAWGPSVGGIGHGIVAKNP